MDRDPNLIDPKSLTQTYDTLVNLWTSGVRGYHSILSDYLTANSFFTAAIGFILARQPPTLFFTLLGMVLCIFGVLMVLQMAIVLGRFSAKIALWEWQLRGIELQTSWTQPQLFIRLERYRDNHQSIEDHRNTPPGHFASTGNGGPAASSVFPYFSESRMSSSWWECNSAFRIISPRCGE